MNNNSLSIDRSITDLVKFVSCALIAAGHYLGHYSTQSGGVNLFQKAILAQGGLLGVALFFFLSGYGLMKSEQLRHLDLRSFITKRILKVYKPVLLSALIWVSLSCPFNESLAAVPWHILLEIIWGWGDGILWFVKALLLLYSEFYIYSLIRQKTNKDVNRIITIIVLCTIAFTWQYYVADYSAVSIPLFFLGIVVADFKLVNRFLSRWAYVCGILLTMTILCILFHSHKLFMHATFNYIVVVLWIFFSNRYCYKISSLPKWIGSFSFDIYLTHNKCLTVLIHFLTVVPFWAFIVSTLVTSYMFYRLRKLLKI